MADFIGPGFFSDDAKDLRSENSLLRAQLADRDAEIERLNHELRETHLDAAEDAVLVAERDAEIERLRADNADLRADLVWSVRKGVMVSHDENLRPCVWFDVHRGVECDGTPDSICRAVREARDGEADS